MKLFFFYLSILPVVVSCAGVSSEKDANAIPATGIKAVAAETRVDTVRHWSTQYIMGKFDPAQDSNFTAVSTLHADRDGLYLRKDTYSAFTKMYDAAKKEGVILQIRSATRNFDYQKGIWENKWKGITPLESTSLANTIQDETERARQILKYSSMPGSSRHHWGTDIDLNAFNNEYFETGAGKQIYSWLKDHANEYGFCQPYTDKSGGRTGYEEEKWHWSYLPVSSSLTADARLFLKDTMITGFLGSGQAVSLGIVDNYVLGVDSTCLLRSSAN